MSEGLGIEDLRLELEVGLSFVEMGLGLGLGKYNVSVPFYLLSHFCQNVFHAITYCVNVACAIYSVPLSSIYNQISIMSIVYIQISSCCKKVDKHCLQVKYIVVFKCYIIIIVQADSL